jgi:microcystin-dependent protein
MDIFLVPTGAIIDFASNSIPPGYLMCDGASYPTATYPNLFGVIGYYYGGSGANFNVPDCRSLATIGAGQGAAVANLTNRVLGNYYGEENHLLSVTEIPSHSHGVYYYSNAQAGTGTNAAWSAAGSAGSLASANTGGSSAHNNMQPSMAFNKIIKT